MPHDARLWTHHPRSPRDQRTPPSLATWSIGFVIGPAAGGLLAEPTVHYPDLFSGMDVFKR